MKYIIGIFGVLLLVFYTVVLTTNKYQKISACRIGKVFILQALPEDYKFTKDIKSCEKHYTSGGE